MNRMRGLPAIVVLVTGCQIVFPLEEPPEVPPGPCPTKAGALVDEFDLPELQPGWTFSRQPDNPAMQATPGKDGLQFLFNTVTGSMAVTHDVGFDLVGSRFAVELEIKNTVGSTSAVEFQLQAVDGSAAPFDGVGWFVDDAGLTPGRLVAGTFTALAAVIPYEPTAHRFLGFSRTGDTTVWSVSSDGLSFDPKFETTTIAPRFFRPSLGVTDMDGGGAMFEATFRGLNTTGAPTEICEISELREPFDTDDTATWGSRREEGCTIAVRDGQLVLTSNAAAFECRHATSGIYDLIGSQVTVEGTNFGPAATFPPGVTLQAEMATMDGDSLAIFGVNSTTNMLVAKVIAPNVDTMVNMKPYDIELHRYWRIVGSVDPNGAQKLEWQVSGDGEAFESFGEFGGLSGFDRARLRFSMFGAAPGTIARFESVNLL